MTQLIRFNTALTGAQLRDLLAQHEIPKHQQLSTAGDLESIRDAVNALPVVDGAFAPATDSQLAPTVHGALTACPRRLLLDNRFWHWMTAVEFPDYVLRRWAPKVDVTAGDALSPGQAKRFLGSSTLAGLGRNALARFFWAAEAMNDVEEGYELTKRFFSRQDLVVGVLEREFGLISPVIRTCARELADLNEDQRRAGLTRLTLRASTVGLEGANEDDIARLLK